jgi:hypothetical protein
VSKRVRGLEVDGVTATVDVQPAVQTYTKRIERSEAWSMRKYERLIERHLKEGLELPKNATYVHTVMRVKTMTQPRLFGRVKAIERAAGAYAVIKMQQFAEVLIMEGLDDVAAEADLALQRLLELPKFAGKNWQQMLASSGGKAFKKSKKKK